MNGNKKASSIAKNIKLLILDVDGVLTDGGIYFDDNGTEHISPHQLEPHLHPRLIV
jgi:3-deoxy-D-manno-octulosonate 8-phosphate phosphatase (KDO 8-P phosphatase)